MNDNLYYISVGIYSMHSLIKHIQIKVWIINYTIVVKESAC